MARGIAELAHRLAQSVRHTTEATCPCSDDGTKLTSHAILRWQEKRAVEWHDIAPGKPQQSGFVESLM